LPRALSCNFGKQLKGFEEHPIGDDYNENRRVEMRLKSENIIDGILAILQGLFLIGLSAIAIFFVYPPLSIAMIAIFGIIGSICFLCGVESLRPKSIS
jgi:hypothetical protein